MSSQTITASVLCAAKQLTKIERRLEPPGPNELQIKIRSTGICGSDLHYYQHYRNGDILIREPMTLGHESAGVVEAIGSAVVDGAFKVGDRVALEVGLPCGHCARCTERRYNICKGMNFRSSAKSFPHFQGTLQDKINHPAAWCYKLHENVTFDQGALLEPLSVAMHATRRAKIVEGETTLVLGAGAVGILTAAMLKASGAGTIVIADIEPQRVDFALKNGFADYGYVVPLKRGASIDEKLTIARETAQSIGDILVNQKNTASEEFDAVFECTGVESCLQTAIYASRPGGRVLMIGMGSPIQTLPISAAALREIDLVGVFRYTSTYEEGISILAGEAGAISKNRKMPDISKLVTHRFRTLDNLLAAFETAGKGQDDQGKLVMKVIIEM